MDEQLPKFAYENLLQKHILEITAEEENNSYWERFRHETAAKVMAALHAEGSDHFEEVCAADALIVELKK